MKFSGFKRVLIDTNQQLDLTLQDPFITKDCIDYIKIHIHISSKGTNNVRNAKQRRLSYRHMSLQPVSITNKNIAGTVLFSYWLHSLYNHRSIAILQQMIDKGYITGPGLPCKLAPLPGRCPICDAAGLTKIPRGSVLKDTTALPLGVLFHMDFCFFNIVSIRGFTAALIIVERTSRYIWFFPTRSKHAPIDLCLFIFSIKCNDLDIPVSEPEPTKMEGSSITLNFVL
jgi:hypothetical protein